jgi:hypothetical protein
MATWTIILRALGIPVFKRGPQARASRKERILQMGKLRYILVFGVLGYAFAFGLGVAIAGIIDNHSIRGRVAVTIVLWSLLGGYFQGVKNWNQLFGKEVPFPPHYPPLK